LDYRRKGLSKHPALAKLYGATYQMGLPKAVCARSAKKDTTALTSRHWKLQQRKKPGEAIKKTQILRRTLLGAEGLFGLSQRAPRYFMFPLWVLVLNKLITPYITNLRVDESALLQVFVNRLKLYINTTGKK
jgi:hypothetical protein